MSTSIQGPVMRSIGLDTFVDITAVSLVLPGGITPDGLLFDGDLSDDEVFEVWARMTSRDDLDQARRATVRALTPCCHACAVLAAYVLGDPLPDPPPPE